MANWAWVFIVNLKGPKGDTGPTGPAFGYKGSLPNNTDLNAIVAVGDNGHYTLSTASTYTNLPPGTAGVGGMLQNITTGFNDTKQIVTWRSGGGVYERQQTSAGAFSAWRRTDRAADDALWTRVNAIDSVTTGWFAQRDRGTLPAGDLNALINKGSNGLWVLNGTNAYTNLPPGLSLTNTGAQLEVKSTGVGDCKHELVVRNAGGIYERQQTSGSNFTAWRRTDRADDTLYGRVAPLERAVGTPGVDGLPSEINAQLRMLGAQVAKEHTPLTLWEGTGIWTARDAGELYLDQIAAKYPAIKLRTLGYSLLGYPIRAAHIGNPAGPTMLLQAGQHGDEVASREAAFLWLREIAASTDPALLTWLGSNCILVVPTVNADMITKTRLSSNGTDLNRNWVLQSTPEVQAAVSVFGLYNVLVAIDAHEGGGTSEMEIDVSPSPEVHASIAALNDALFNVVTDAFTSAGRPVGEFPSEPALTWAMNHMSAVKHVPCLLTESPSLLAPNIYTPSPLNRVNDQLLAFRTVFAHFRANQAAYAAAKANAGG